jgi:hypothetical protein
VYQCFSRIVDPRRDCKISRVDALMSGLAVFGLKYPSLLSFDNDRQTSRVRHNLETLYRVKHAPCDTQLRTILDEVDWQALRPAFRELHQVVQRQGGLKAYEYLDGYALVSIDGTGQFASGEVSCPHCCVKHTRKGERYFHQLLGAAMVHPALKTVLPFAPEPITRADGEQKNDCERNAVKRLVEQLRQDYPQRKMIILGDALFATGPYLKQLKALDFRFIIGVKPGDHEALFEALDAGLADGSTQEWEYVDEHRVEHGYRWRNQVALNASHPELKVNVLEYWQIKAGQQTVFSWVTDLELFPARLEKIMRGGRARWKIENETFNTLKNQGYHLEHNYGHGKCYLASVMALLMMLAFLIDQIQEHGCRVFQAALAKARSRARLWEQIRVRFLGFLVPDWEALWRSIIQDYAGGALGADTS